MFILTLKAFNSTSNESHIDKECEKNFQGLAIPHTNRNLLELIINKNSEFCFEKV